MVKASYMSSYEQLYAQYMVLLQFQYTFNTSYTIWRDISMS